MTPEQEQGNRKIAELMEFTQKSYKPGGEKMWCDPKHGLPVGELIFHSDSNWQDSVLKRIEELGYSWEISYDCHDRSTSAQVTDGFGHFAIVVEGEKDQPKSEVVFELLVKFCDYINQKEK